ncbi:MAG: hypothetical protein L0154_24350 [Chloroflexi bacterium]|nr:hypothetical protein [Chloroflexota bacterium]
MQPASRYHLHSHWERLTLYLIIAIGAWLRFQNLGTIKFNIDQVYPIWQALNTLDSGQIVLTGQNTSVIFPNPPLTGYLYLPLVAATRSPLSVLVLVIPLNTFAIYLVFLSLRWIIGTRPALVGTALFATNPWLVEASRHSWVQSLMIFFLALIFWALVPVLIRQTNHPARRLTIALVSFAIFANTYLLAYALIIPMGILFVIYPKRIPRKALITGGSVFLVLMMLYLGGLYKDRNLVEQQLMSYRSGDWQFTVEPLKNSIRLISGWDFAVTHGKNAPINDWEQRKFFSDGLNLLWASLLFAGVVHTLCRAVFDSERRDIGVLLLIWFFFPIVSMSYISRPVHLHYQIFGIPAGYAMIAWLLVPVLKRPAGAVVLSAMLISTGAVNTLDTIRFAQATEANPSQHYPTLMLFDMMEMGDIINENRGDAVVYTDIYEWTIMASAGRTLPVTRTFGFNAQVIAAEGSFYIYRNTSPNLLHAPKLDAVLELEDNQQLSFWAATQNFAIPNHTVIPSDIGVSFVGWEIVGELRAGETVELRTYWHIDQLLPERFDWVFSPYVHVFDSSGNRVVNAPGAVLETFTWRQSDLVIHRIPLTLPPDSQVSYSINTGLFDSIRFVNAIFRIPQNKDDTLFTADIPLIQHQP